MLSNNCSISASLASFGASSLSKSKPGNPRLIIRVGSEARNCFELITPAASTSSKTAFRRDPENRGDAISGRFPAGCRVSPERNREVATYCAPSVRGSADWKSFFLSYRAKAKRWCAPACPSREVEGACGGRSNKPTWNELSLHLHALAARLNCANQRR